MHGAQIKKPAKTIGLSAHRPIGPSAHQLSAEEAQ
jgi:hypothetical protein